MDTKQKALIIVAAATLAGCGTTPTTKPASTTPQATIVWQTQAALAPSVVVMDADFVYTAGAGRIEARTVEDGSIAWTVADPALYADGVPRDMAVTADGLIVVTPKALEGRSLTNGDVLWRQDGIAPTNVAAGGTIAVVADDQTMWAIVPHTGGQHWNIPCPGILDVAMSNDIIYVLRNNGSGFVLEAYNHGAMILWTQLVPVGYSRLAADSAGVYAYGSNGLNHQLMRLDSGGHFLWIQKLAAVTTEPDLIGTIAADETATYVSNGEGTVGIDQIGNVIKTAAASGNVAAAGGSMAFAAGDSVGVVR